MQIFRKLKPFTKKSIIFLVILLVLTGIMSVIFSWGAKRSTDFIADRNRNIIGVQAEPDNSLDILFLGSSISFFTFSPMDIWQDTGITSYLCGQTSQQVQEGYSLLKIALKKQQPKVVVIETGMLYENQGRADELRTMLREFKNYYFPLFTYHDIWKNLFDLDRSMDPEFKGYFPRKFYVDYYSFPEGYYEPTDEVENFSSISELYMDKIINLCHKKGIEVMLISSPSPYNYSMAKHNAIEAYANDRDLMYVDLNTKIQELNLELPYDYCDSTGEHLSYWGSLKATAYTINLLQENFEFTDHRDDPAYQKWHEDAKEYNKLLDNL